jgi:hypothetical protein
VFGLGFDTATEVALLATTALLASQHIPWYAILCLPILFTAGMTVMDTTWPCCAFRPTSLVTAWAVRMPGRAALGEAVRFGVVEWLVFAYTESCMAIVIQDAGRLP